MSQPSANPCPRILLLADQDAFSAALHSGLASAGYEICCADAVDGALSLLGQQQFALAILDDPLPCSTQHQLVRLLKEEYRIPFVVLTTCDDSACMNTAITEGALAYLFKPLDLSQLLPMIATAVARGTDLQSLRDTRDQLQNALNQERDISIATGMVMVLLNLDRAAAFDHLRRQARSSRRKLGDVAHELIDNRGASLKT